MRTLKDMEFDNKKVLLRVGFDVPLDDNGNVLDDSRIKSAIPTINYILDQGAKQLIIITHLGRPDGKVVEKLKTDRVAVRLMKLTGRTVYKVNACIDVNIPENRKIVFLENVRFYKEEEANDDEFAKKLASHADVYVNDAFGVSHRTHASVHAITKFLPGCIGLLMEKELNALDITRMKKPIIALIGGAKLKTKIPLIQRMLVAADRVLIGGAMIFTFYASKKYEIGHSLFDKDFLKNAEMMFHNEHLLIPVDIVIADYENEEANITTVDFDNIPKKSIGLDIGKKSVAMFKKELRKAETIIWNGPMGYFEKPPFDKATNDLAEIISDLDCNKIIGGGDTLEVINKLGIANKFTFVSSGGGASLEVLSGKKLAAIEALEKQEE